MSKKTDDQNIVFGIGKELIHQAKDYKELTTSQLRQALKAYDQLPLEYDQVSNMILNATTHLEPSKQYMSDIKQELEDFYGVTIPGGYATERVFDELALLNRVNRFADFVNELPQWDGTSRMSEMLIHTLGVKDNDYYRAASALLVLSIILRAKAAGSTPQYYVKQDHMFVITGPADLGKSSFISALVGNERLVDDTINLTTQNDNVMRMAGTLVNEVAELSSIDGRSVDRIKAFISNRLLTFRVPYATNNTSMYFHNTLIATTNNPQILNDPTGNRKFIMIDIDQKVNTDWLIENRDQIYAEALVWYQQHDEPMLRIPDLAKTLGYDADLAQQSAVSAQNKHAMFNPIVDVIESIVSGQADDVVAGLAAQISDDKITRWDSQQRLVALNISSLRSALDNVTMGQRGADAQDIRDAISRPRTYKIEAQKAIEKLGFVSSGQKATQWNLTRSRGWFYQN